MDLKLYALLKSKIKDSASTCAIVSSDASEAELTLSNNTEYRFTNPVSRLVINEFSAGDKNFTEVWSVCFTAGDGISVVVPSNLEWAVAEPAFTAGYTYFLSFIPFDDKVLGVWIAKELTA